MGSFVGVDGCPGGWFAVAIDSESSSRVDVERHETFPEVLAWATDAERLLVDMPIGLPETGRRACDEAARERLGDRRSTVFFAPCRAVLDATSHEEASRVNRERTGYGLSIQAWNLVPRIDDVDTTLQSNVAARAVVREAHPELCFAALGDGPLREPKSTPEGRTARLHCLQPIIPAVDRIYEDCLDAFLRRDLRRDDVLDALVLAVSARRPLGRVPDVEDEPVPRDAVGLPMEICYPTEHSGVCCGN